MYVDTVLRRRYFLIIALIAALYFHCLPFAFGWQQESGTYRVPPTRMVTLPTDRSMQSEGWWPLDQDGSPTPNEVMLPGEPVSSPPAVDYWSLLRPRANFVAEWEPETEGFGLASYDLRLTMPTYPFFGPPPPMIIAGFSYTDLDSPAVQGLPGSLYDVSLGAAWIRKLNERWTMRLSASAALATDAHNESSHAWQFRGGVFAMWQQTPTWQWAFGALATGRQDLPVLPAVGAIWEPSPRWQINLTFPIPKVRWLWIEGVHRQHWLFAGAGFSGGTWAYRTTGGQNDLLTYREWRATVGWESTRPKPPGAFIAPGPKWGVEVGYVFARNIEFDSARPDYLPENSLLLRTTLSY